MSKAFVRVGLLAAGLMVAASFVPAHAADLGLLDEADVAASRVSKVAWVCDGYGDDECVWRDDYAVVEEPYEDVEIDTYETVRPYVPAAPVIVERAPVVVAPDCFWRRGVLGRQKYICP